MSEILAPTLDDGLLLECVVTTENADGSVNVAPMGPIVDPAFERVLLRPYEGSVTLANLKRDPRCVLNITDDVELIARSALNLLEREPDLTKVNGGGWALADGCRWYSLEAISIDDSRPRHEVLCRVTAQGKRRPFVGFNRAMHAVIEATILATRLHLIPREEVLRKFAELQSPVEKTGGRRERRAFELVRRYVAEQPSTDSADSV